MANTKRIRLWVHALRNNKYKQGTGFLRSSKNKFCCLGVACDLYEKDVKKTLWDRGTDAWTGKTSRNYFFGTSSSTANLPKQVARWLGISTSQETLITMNDGGNSFETIAKHIEKKYLTK